MDDLAVRQLLRDTTPDLSSVALSDTIIHRDRACYTRVSHTHARFHRELSAVDAACRTFRSPRRGSASH